jgi:hypothetical protein
MAASGDKAQRYSEKRLKDAFTAYVLFAEPLTFRPSEILAAVREDYPGLAWTDTLQLDMPITVGQVGLGVLFPDAEAGNEPRMAHFSSFPGLLGVDLAHQVHASRLTFPDAAAAVARHRCYLSITVPSVDDSLAARFDAARRVTCLAAVFARLSTCVAVYFPTSDQIVRPADWVEAAAQAMRAELPIPTWVSIYVNAMPDGRAPDGRAPAPVTVGTIGLAAFNGHEIAMPRARILPGDAAKWVFGAAKMLVERDHVFHDSDTLGMEEGGETLRIRHCPEGKADSQTDAWILLHPSSTLDEMAFFGPHSRPPAPPGVDNRRKGDTDGLRKRLYAFVTGGRDKAGREGRATGA